MIHVISNLFPRVGFPSIGIFVIDHAKILSELSPLKAIVLKTVFPGINIDWKQYGAKPVTSSFPVSSLALHTLPYLKTPSLSSKLLFHHYQKLLGSSKPKLAVLHFLYPSLLLTPYLIKNKIPFILHAHGNDVNIILQNDKLKILAEKAFSEAEYVFFAGKETMEKAQRNLTISESKCTYFPNPIVIDQSLQMENKLSHFEKNVVTIANIIERKGLNHILDLAIKQPEIGFHIIGLTPSSNYARNFQMKAQELSNLWIHKPMDRPRLHAFLQSADMYIHSSITEPFGMAVCEAILCGLPVLARKVGVLSDFDESEQLRFFDSEIFDNDFLALLAVGRFKESPTLNRIKEQFSPDAIKKLYQSYLSKYF